LKAYSAVNFIRLHYEGTKSKNPISAFFQKTRWNFRETLHILITYFDYLELETFIGDLKESAEEDIPFYVEDLLVLLYEDFIRQVREFSDMESLSKKLAYKQQKHRPQTDKKVDYARIAPNQQRRFEYEVRRKQAMMKISMQITRKAGLRGEVLLMKMAQTNSEFHLTLEELLSILVKDFLENIHKGSKSAIMESILDRITEI